MKDPDLEEKERKKKVVQLGPLKKKYIGSLIIYSFAYLNFYEHYRPGKKYSSLNTTVPS